MNKQVGSDEREVDQVGIAPDVLVHEPLDLAIEAIELRQQEKEIKERLAEIGRLLQDYPLQTWRTGDAKYKVTTATRQTIKVDEDKLRVVNPKLFKACTKQMLDVPRIKTLIDDGALGDTWMKWAKKIYGNPYVTVNVEFLDDEDGIANG